MLAVRSVRLLICRHFDGKKRTYATMDEATEGKRIAQRQKKLSRGHAAGLHRDEPQSECPMCEWERAERDTAEPTLHEYAREVIERYQGTGRRGYREETRHADRQILERHALTYFPAGVKLSAIGPKQIAEFIDWLGRQQSNRKRPLSDSSVRNALKPLRYVLSTARREGLITHNPATDAVLPIASRLRMMMQGRGRSRRSTEKTR